MMKLGKMIWNEMPNFMKLTKFPKKKMMIGSSRTRASLSDFFVRLAYEKRFALFSENDIIKLSKKEKGEKNEH